jgi:glyoxylase-like metal-dependent hydrolase (beta-lactamase superfamily II)
MSPLSNPAWFSPRAVAPGVWRVSEPGHVNAWLVEGSERAVLIDSGLGIFGIREVVASLLADPSKPVGVANTHSHFDHIGGNQEFDDIAIHEAGAAQLKEPCDRELIETYVKMIPPMHEAFERQRIADEANFTFMFTPDEWIRGLPAGFEAPSWEIPAVSATRTLHDGDRIGLGGRTLEVLHTPGHSPDSVSYWLEDESILLTGDTVCSGRIWAHQEEGDVQAFARSARRLAGMADDVRLVLMGHHLRPVIEGTYLTEVAAAFEAAAAGDLAAESVDDDFGDPALLVRHGRVEIYLPDPARRRTGVFDEWAPSSQSPG